MILIKLNAIDSTNDYLKELSRHQNLENFTVVFAENQTKGRGQMGSNWESEKGKNLTMSVLVSEVLHSNMEIFSLNIAVALSVLSVLEEMNIPGLSVKWPNDIMSGNKKMGGILIENSFRADGSIHSVIGIGLNVNQIDFNDLPKATSVAVETDKIWDLVWVLNRIVERLKMNCHILNKNTDLLWQQYHEKLFKLNVPMAFQDKEGVKFMGIIRQVNRDGKLQVQLENDSVVRYGLKEIQMLY